MPDILISVLKISRWPYRSDICFECCQNLALCLSFVSERVFLTLYGVCQNVESLCKARFHGWNPRLIFRMDIATKLAVQNGCLGF